MVRNIEQKEGPAMKKISQLVWICETIVIRAMALNPGHMVFAFPTAMG
jgi:hypothetical protein